MSWREKALEMHHQGMSWRQIAKQLNKPKSSVSDALRKMVKGYVKPSEVVFKGGEVIDSMSSGGRTHLIIADTQCKPSQSLSYMLSLGKYIADKQPDVIIHIGDHYDFESLSTYDKGKRSFEGRRLKADIEAGNEGLRLLTLPLKELQKEQEARGEKVYKPEMVFVAGNHESRLDRLVDDIPELYGMFGVDQLPIEEYGFKVYPFLKPVEVDGINYVHYLANPFTGKPYGGSALNQLKNVGNSFVVGHKQTLDVAMRPTLDGSMQIGIINGSCYPFEEAYKGFQGNFHFRGVTVLHEVKDGFGLPMFVSLEYIMNKYN